MHTVNEWSRPSDYFGAEWHGWYSAGFGQSRDSDALEASNFATAHAVANLWPGKMGSNELYALNDLLTQFFADKRENSNV